MATTKLILYIDYLYFYHQKVKKETGTKNKNGHKINVRFSFSQNSFVNKGCVFWVLTYMLCYPIFK